jgi:hypothetical protein
LPVFPLRYFVAAKIPKYAKLVTFPGGPNPSDIIVGRWDEEVHPFQNAKEHIANALSLPMKSRWRYIKRFVLPCDWIAEHWRE